MITFSKTIQTEGYSFLFHTIVAEIIMLLSHNQNFLHPHFIHIILNKKQQHQKNL